MVAANEQFISIETAGRCVHSFPAGCLRAPDLGGLLVGRDRDLLGAAEGPRRCIELGAARQVDRRDFIGGASRQCR